VNTFDRLADALVQRAARRWPADAADSMLREWRAELAALQTQPQTRPAARAWRQLAFALSLACSPTAEPRGSIGSECKRIAVTFARAGRQFVLAFGVVLLARFVVVGMHVLAGQLVTHNRYDVEPATWWHVTAYVGADIVGLAIMSLVAVFALRRTRLAIRPAAVLIVPLALASYLVYLAANSNDAYGSGELIRAQGATSIGAWALVLLAAVGVGRRLAAAGRRTAAWGVTGLGAFVAADVAAFIASVRAAGPLHIGRGSGLLWLPLSYLPDGFTGFGPLIPAGTTRIGNASFTSDQPFPALSLLLPLSIEVAVPLLMCSAFVLVAVLRMRPQSATAVERTEPAPHPRVVASWRPRLVRPVAVTASVLGLAVWAATTGLAGSAPDDIFRSNVFQVEFAAALLTVLGVAMGSVGRELLVLPAVGLMATLLVTSAITARTGWTGAGATTALAAVGVVAAAVAWWVGERLPRPAAPETTGRRALVGVAVIGALAAPTAISVSDIFANHAWIPTAYGAIGPSSPPALLSLASVGAAALLLATAFVAALASRRTPLSRPAFAVFLAAYALVFLIGIVDGDAVRRALYWTFPSFFVQPVLVVVLVALIRWRPGQGQLRSLGWCAAGIVGAVASVALSEPLSALGVLLSAGYLRVAASLGLDGMDAGLLWAQVALGIAVAFALGPWIAPHDRPDATNPAAPAGEPEPQPA
jgi:hypothetical protein